MTDHPRAFYLALDRTLQREPTVAVATIVQTRGSSPRSVGAKMLVKPNGQSDGTVGGGCGEAEVWKTALEVMADHQPRTVNVDLTEDIAMNTDGVCGGIMEIFVEPWLGPDGHEQPLNGTARFLHDGVVTGVEAALAARQPAIVATIVSTLGVPGLGEKVLVVDGEVRAGGLSDSVLLAQVLANAPALIAAGEPVTRVHALDRGSASVFYDVVLPKPTLVVVGAGHVGVPLAQVGSLLDFEVIVVDDRPAYANASRFPTASQIIVDDFEDALASIPMTPYTYVVLVTRGHVHDVRSLRHVVQQNVAYIGMIGSRRRVFAVLKLLRDEGVPLDVLLRIHAPIGLDIKTETPGEIAVSVGAELVKVRRGGGAASFSDTYKDQYRYQLTHHREPAHVA